MRAPSVPTPVRDPSTTRAAPSPRRAGRGEGLGAGAPHGNAQGARLAELAARKLSSPSLPSLLTSETHLPARPGSRALTSGPPCAHPLSTLSRSPSPSHACGSRPLPRAPSCTAARARGAPSPPCSSPGLAAPRRASPAPGSGAREPQPRAATGFRPLSAGQKPREARGALGAPGARGEGRSGAGRGGGARSLAHSRLRTRPYKLSHRHTRGALPPPAAAPPPATALRGRERERGRESALSARRRPARDSAPRRQPR